MIDGKFFRDSIISASNNIGNYRKSVDALNVFPVPDGDTGTNMSMTVAAAAREASMLADSCSVGEATAVVASALLRGARGNSGVILSLIFRGVASGLKNCERADGTALAAALTLGMENAYKAVMKPTEGTILTVVRLAAQSGTAQAEKGASAEDVWNAVCAAAELALADTPNILPVLKKAGVVDAGGQGLVHIFNGMRSVFSGEGIIASGDASVGAPASPFTAAETHEEIKFTYCTEFLINRSQGMDTSSVKLRAYLESIGDCVVVVEDESIIKVHCHSNEPDNVLRAALQYGMLTNIKIDNMRHQHESASWGVAPKSEPHEEKPVISEPEKEFGIVTVSVGAGLDELFTSLGADTVVSGGQTMNPSTEDILQAIEKTNAKQIFVLPNNKNIIMAAEQAVPLTEKRVNVLHTRTIPEGVAAVLMFDSSLSADENHIAMSKAAECVSTAQVTYAARDSEIDSQPVKKGQVIGLENGKITVVDTSPVSAAFKTVKSLVKKNSTLITVYYGEDASEEQANELKDMLDAKLGKGVEVVIVNGGQPVYSFLVSVE